MQSRYIIILKYKISRDLFICQHYRTRAIRMIVISLPQLQRSCHTDPSPPPPCNSENHSAVMHEFCNNKLMSVGTLSITTIASAEN